MIYMLTGKPRAGKSLLALRRIVQELSAGHRVVVTNLAIKLPELAAYLQKKYPHKNIDLLQRLRLLTDEQTKHFWLYRRPEVPGDEGRVDGVTTEQEKKGQFPTWPAKYRAVLYVIDEAHIHFDARRWMEAGHSLTFYNSQHGKLDDETYFVTQFLDLVDKRLKGFAQLYIYVVNQGLRRFLSFFSPPSYMVAKAYSQPVQNGKDEHFEWSERWLLDKELADCYDTSQGVGMPGSGKPETKPKKGLSMVWIIPVAFVVVYAAVKSLGLVTWGVGKTLKGASTSASTAAHVDSQAEGRQVPSVLVQKQKRASTDTVPIASQAESPPTVYVRSIARRGAKVIVTLSDGRQLVSGLTLGAVTPLYVQDSDRKRYPYRRDTTTQERSAGPKGPRPNLVNTAPNTEKTP